MASDQTKCVAERAKRLYSERLQPQMEAEHYGRYLAIEPESGDHFLGDSYSEAVGESRLAHPDRIAFVIRVGYGAAVHIGVLTN